MSGPNGLDILNLLGNELGKTLLEGLCASHGGRSESPRKGGAELFVSAMVKEIKCQLEALATAGCEKEMTDLGSEGGTGGDEAHCEGKVCYCVWLDIDRQ